MSNSDSGQVVVALNAELCVGVGNCELLQPDHFTVDEETGIAAMTGSGAVSAAEAEQLIDRCPSGALTIID